MAFSPRNIVGRFLKKRLTKGGGGVTGTQGPSSLAMPLRCTFFMVKGDEKEPILFMARLGGKVPVGLNCFRF